MRGAIVVVGGVVAALLAACEGLPSVPDGLRLCQDYGAVPYRVKRDDGGFVYQHAGVDFCTPSGTPVIAVTRGRVVRIVGDSPLDGGGVTIETELVAPSDVNDIPVSRTRVYARVLHIVPRAGLAEGDLVEAGGIVGHTQDPEDIVNANTPHVHFELTTCPDNNYLCPVDPHAYWRDGPDHVACLGQAPDVPADRIVAPLRCAAR